MEKIQKTEMYCKCVLVTGGVGFVGSHIVEALLKEGRKVVVYDLFNAETTKNEEKFENAEILRKAAAQYEKEGASLYIVKGDIADQDLVSETVQKYGVTACIHTGAMVNDRRSINFPEEYIQANVVGTTRLLDALGRSGVRMVVQASTRSVFGHRNDKDAKLDENAERRPINPYGVSKVGADAVAHCYSYMYNMKVTVIRVFATYGMRGRPDMIPRILIENIYHDLPIRKYGDGMATRTWIYISDVVSAFMMALTHPQDGYVEYNLGSPSSTTLNEMIECAEKICGKKAIVEHHPAPLGDAKWIGRPCYDKITDELGWKPVVGLMEGMRLFYEEYVNYVSKVKNEGQ